MKKTISKIIILSLLIIPHFVHAQSDSISDFFGDFEINNNEAVIENNISVSASSGGNRAESGQVVEGKTSSSVQIETRINGQMVVNENFEETGETLSEVRVEAKTVANEEGVKTETISNLENNETEDANAKEEKEREKILKDNILSNIVNENQGFEALEDQDEPVAVCAPPNQESKTEVCGNNEFEEQERSVAVFVELVLMKIISNFINSIDFVWSKLV